MTEQGQEQCAVDAGLRPPTSLRGFDPNNHRDYAYPRNRWSLRVSGLYRAFLHHNNMTTALAHYLPSKVLKHPDNGTATQGWQTWHYTTTSTWWVSIVSGSPRSARTSRHNLMASFTFSKACSFVVPWLTQPGMAGHSAIHTPSSSRSMVTVNFILSRLPGAALITTD